MVERPLSMREVPGSMPGFSVSFALVCPVLMLLERISFYTWVDCYSDKQRLAL